MAQINFFQPFFSHINFEVTYFFLQSTKNNAIKTSKQQEKRKKNENKNHRKKYHPCMIEA